MSSTRVAPPFNSVASQACRAFTFSPASHAQSEVVIPLGVGEDAEFLAEQIEVCS
jgi:hypothetical protein